MLGFGGYSIDNEHCPISILNVVYGEILEAAPISLVPHRLQAARQPSSNAKGRMIGQVVLNYNVQSIFEHKQTSTIAGMMMTGDEGGNQHD